MATREEIRDGIEGVLDAIRDGKSTVGEALLALVKLGVVIKVETWLPTRSGMTCTIEPLVEE